MKSHLNLDHFLYSLGICVVVGCGGGGVATDSGGGGGGGGATLAEKTAAAQAVANYANNLDPTNKTAYVAAIAAKMRSMPAFKNVTEGDGIVMAKFQDDMDYGVLDNREAIPAAAPIFHRQLAHELPQNKTYASLNALGNVFVSQNGKLGGWLGGAGYTDGGGVMTPAGFISAANRGVIYLDTHGGVVNGRYGVWTLDRVGDPAADAANAPYVADKTVFWFTAAHNKGADGKPVNETHYVISPEFVTKYASFPKDSFMFCNACQSNNASWKAALKGKNLSAYAGWVLDIKDDMAGKGALYLFDRILGQNEQDPENPHQRPFDVMAAYNDLKSRGKLHDNRDGNDLIVTPLGGTFALARPTIKYLTVKGYERELQITGDFGTTQGTVSIGGVDASVTSWGANLVKVTLPDSGAGSCGDVLVKVSGVKSTPVQLSHWEGDVFYEDKHTAIGDSVDIKCRWHVSIRADVHEFRDTPHVTPVGPSVFGSCDRTSSCHWSCTGSQGTGAIVWSGSGDPPQSPPGPNTTGSLFQIAYTIDVKNKKLQLGLNAVDKDKISVVSSSGTQKIGFGPNAQVFDERPGPFALPTLDIPLANDFSVPTGNRTYQASGLGADIFTLNWSTMQTGFPPDPNGSHRPSR